MHDTDHSIGRRPVLKTAGMTLAGLGGLASPVAAGKGKVGHLNDTTADVLLRWGDKSEEADDPDEVTNFTPFFPMFTDPGTGDEGSPGLFDGTDIEISPNNQTLHHSLRFFAGFLMKGKAKPYTLVNTGDALFEARGQTANFEARSKQAIRARLEKAIIAFGFSEEEAKALATQLVNNPPFGTLAGGKWRAVATEQLKVNLDSTPPFDSEWSATRVDFYSRGGGQMEYTLTLIYSIWASGDSAAMGQSLFHSNRLIKDGRLNSGGK